MTREQAEKFIEGMDQAELERLNELLSALLQTLPPCQPQRASA